MADDKDVAAPRAQRIGGTLEDIARGLRTAAGDAELEATVLDAIAALHEPEPELRAIALRELTGLGIFLSHRLAALELGLDDPAVLVRRAAASALEHLGAELAHHFHRGHQDIVLRVLRVLVHGLRDEDPGVRERTAAAFVTLDLDLARRSRTGTIASIPSTAVDEPPRVPIKGLVRHALRTHHAALALAPASVLLATDGRTPRLATSGGDDPVDRLWLLCELIAAGLDEPRLERSLEEALRALARFAPLALANLTSLGLPAATRALSALGAEALPEHFVEALVERLDDAARPELRRTARTACHALARRGELPKRLRAALERAGEATPGRLVSVGG